MFETNLNRKLNIVEVRLGSGGHDDHVSSRDALFAFCQENRVFRIVIDARELQMDESAGTMDFYEFAVSWVEMAAGAPIRIAGVLPRDAASRNDVVFGDNVAHNRGLMTGAFTDIDAARAWLCGKETCREKSQSDAAVKES